MTVAQQKMLGLQSLSQNHSTQSLQAVQHGPQQADKQATAACQQMQEAQCLILTVRKL
jgi:hypothetical protein